MPLKIIIAALLVSCCMLLSAIFACGHKSSAITKPSAEKGIIDIRNWNFKEDGCIELHGEWEFFPNLLLNTADFLKPTVRNNNKFISVPGLWEDCKINSAGLTGKGQATYRLIIISSADKKPKTVSINGVYSGYKLWINGILEDKIGTPDKPVKSREDYVFIHNERRTSFTPREGENEIILQVFNSEYKSGGIKKSIKLEDGEASARKELNRYTVDMIIVGLLLFVSIYNIVFFFFRKEEYTFLLTGLFSLVWAINTYNINSPILYAGLSHLRKPFLIDYITVILGLTLCIWVVRSMFSEDVSIYIVRLAEVLAAGIIVMLFFVDFKTAEKVMNYYFIFCIFCGFYGLYVLIRTVIKHRKDAILFGIGIVSFFIGGINSVLYALWIIDTGNAMHYGMAIFCITATIIVSRRFSGALHNIEELNRDFEAISMSLKNREAGSRDLAAETLLISCRNKSYSIGFNGIVYITSHSKNIVIHTRENDIELPVLMKEITVRLPSDMFVRIHKSYIINIRFIRSISHVLSGRYMVRLSDSDETELPVGRVFLSSLREKINN